MTPTTTPLDENHTLYVTEGPVADIQCRTIGLFHTFTPRQNTLYNRCPKCGGRLPQFSFFPDWGVLLQAK